MSLLNLSKDLLKAIDIVIEVADSRLPITSRHPSIQIDFKHKLKIVIYAKADLADLDKARLLINKQEISYFLTTKSTKQRQKILTALNDLGASLKQRSLAKGYKHGSLKLLVVGIPNVGKSSLINWLIGQNKAKVANRPGITRAPQWVRINPDIELLDTPGVLKHFKFDPSKTTKLGLVRLINAYNIDELELATSAIDFTSTFYNESLTNYLGANNDISLESVAKKFNYLKTGGVYDLNRAAKTFLSDFESGKLGKICLDIDQLKSLADLANVTD